MIELKRFVESVVRPVPQADTTRRLRMREELYAHLLDIYYHEAQSTDSELEAIARAIARMGNPEDLTAELSSTLSWVDRAAFQINQTFERRPNEGKWARAARLSAIFAGLMTLESVTFICIFAGSEVLAWSQNGQIIVRLLLSLIFCFGVGTFLLTLLSEHFVKPFTQLTRWQDLLWPSLQVVLVAVIVFFGLGIFIYCATVASFQYLPTAALTCLPGALAAGLVTAGVLIAGGSERRRMAPWLELDIET